MSRMEVVEGDITKLGVDAIVNAANTSLLGGGGVDGAIHRAAGFDLLAECKTLNGCETGKAKITKAYCLPAKYIIHAVGPVWNGGSHDEDALLASCYTESLKLAVKHKIKTIAFPAISCGAYHFPIDRAVTIAVGQINEFLSKHKSIEKVYFVCFSDEIYDAYQRAIAAAQASEL